MRRHRSAGPGWLLHPTPGASALATAHATALDATALAITSRATESASGALTAAARASPLAAGPSAIFSGDLQARTKHGRQA